MKLQEKPIDCPFCGCKTFVGQDDVTMECYIECRNDMCIGKPGFRGVQYGNIEELLNKLIIAWNSQLSKHGQALERS
jgi:hypothetical protein